MLELFSFSLCKFIDYLAEKTNLQETFFTQTLSIKKLLLVHVLTFNFSGEKEKWEEVSLVDQEMYLLNQYSQQHST